MRRPRLRIWMLMTLVAAVAIGLAGRRLQKQYVECRRLTAFHAKMALRYQTDLRVINRELARDEAMWKRLARPYYCSNARREFDAVRALSAEYTAKLAEHTKLKNQYQRRWW